MIVEKNSVMSDRLIKVYFDKKIFQIPGVDFENRKLDVIEATQTKVLLRVGGGNCRVGYGTYKYVSPHYIIAKTSPTYIGLDLWHLRVWDGAIEIQYKKKDTVRAKRLALKIYESDARYSGKMEIEI